jgi:hypothetical protein
MYVEWVAKVTQVSISYPLHGQSELKCKLTVSGICSVLNAVHVYPRIKAVNVIR